MLLLTINTCIFTLVICLGMSNTMRYHFEQNTESDDSVMIFSKRLFWLSLICSIIGAIIYCIYYYGAKHNQILPYGSLVGFLTLLVGLNILFVIHPGLTYFEYIRKNKHKNQ